MSDIPVNCGHCGNVFSVPEKLAGQSTVCPQCTKQVAVLDSSARSDGAGKLQMKHDKERARDRCCPSCKASMAPEAAICLQCGYDTRTGSQYLDRPQQSRILQWVLWGVGLIILAGLLKTFVFKGGSDEVQGTAVSAEQQAAAAAPAAPGEAAAAQSADGAQTSVTSAVGGPADQPSAEEEKLQAEYREKLMKQLAITYPMYAPGDAVVLRRVNGQIHRGALGELTADAVVVVNGGQTNKIPLKVLDRASRLKCDPAFRAEIVNFHVQKRAKEVVGF